MVLDNIILFSSVRTSKIGRRRFVPDPADVLLQLGRSPELLYCWVLPSKRLVVKSRVNLSVTTVAQVSSHAVLVYVLLFLSSPLVWYKMVSCSIYGSLAKLTSTHDQISTIFWISGKP